MVFGAAVVASTAASAWALSVAEANPPGMWTRDVLSVDSAEELIAATPLIIEGRVATSSKGRVVGEGDGALRLREIAVDVTRSWGGARAGAADVPKQVTLEIVGWDADGTEYEHINGQEVPQPGESWIMFLVEKRDAPGYFRPVNSHAMARLAFGKVEGAQIESESDHDRHPLEQFLGGPVEDLDHYLDSKVTELGS